MENKNIQHELEKSKAELLMLYEIGNAMRTTLKLDEILYIILTGTTSGEGLGFNRAMLFLVNEKDKVIEGKMGIGPDTGEEAHLVWKQIEADKMTLDNLIGAYNEFDKKTDNQLNNLVKSIKIPLKENAGIIALTALEGMPFEVTTEEAKFKINDPISTIIKTDFFVTVPLKSKDKVVGVILADNIFTKKPITKDDLRILTMFANQAGLAIENSKLYEQTLLLSNTDSLTSLCNHGYFQYLLDEEIKRAERYQKPLSLVMMDIDNFKNFNDSNGHQAGDKILVEISKILKKISRETDIVARYGGEEFALILLQANKEKGFVLAERLRAEIEKYPFEGKEVQPNKKLTISGGIASYPQDATTKDKLIYKADMALYEAKKKGKNMICVTS